MFQTEKRLLKCTAFLPCILFLLASSSCVQKRLDARLASHSATQKEVYQDLKAVTYSNPNAALSWPQAKKLLLERNLSYQNLVHSHQQATERRKEIFLNLIPRIFTFASINSSIDRIADIETDDIDLNITSNLNIPNPVAFYSQLYAAALAELQSTYQLELGRRQLISRLYAQFIRARQLREREAQLRELEETMEKQPIDSIGSAIVRLKNSKFQFKSSRENLRTSTNSLLNTPGHHWSLNGTLPDISYEDRIHSLSFANGFGTLGLKLQTLQIEGILISLVSAKAARLPSLSLGLSSPQLYNNNSDDNFEFNAEDYQLFSGLSKTFELTDVFDRDSLRNAQFRAKTSRQQLRLRLESEISRLESTKRTYRKLLQERTLAKKAIAAINTSSATPTPQQLEYEISRLQSARNTLENINRQLTQLDLQLWIFDDSHWN